MIPVVVRSTEEMLKLVPERAAGGLLCPRGAEVEDDLLVVLPTAFSGIVTGVLLGLARIMGETAPLLILGPYTKAIASNLFGGYMATLPTMINQDRDQAADAAGRPDLGRRAHADPAHPDPQPARPLHRPAARSDIRRQPATDPPEGDPTMAKRIDVKTSTSTTAASRPSRTSR
jgi:hypothetical protein